MKLSDEIIKLVLLEKYINFKQITVYMANKGVSNTIKDNCFSLQRQW